MAPLIRSFLIALLCSSVCIVTANAQTDRNVPIETPSEQEVEVCLLIVAELMEEAEDMSAEEIRIEQQDAAEFCRSGAFFDAIDEAFGEEDSDLTDQTGNDDEEPIDRPDWIK